MTARATTFDSDKVRRDFPLLATSVHGKPLIYFDNAATTQKPLAVIERLNDYYRHENANIHRGVHLLSQRATDAYEQARAKVRAFLNAREDREIVFVRGATEGINLVAQSFGVRHWLRRGDTVVLSGMEHHSNIVPWQMACAQTGAVLKAIPVTDSGELDLAAAARLLEKPARLLAVVHVSNALGTVNPAKELIRLAHAHQVPVLLDGAQAVAHLPVDVQDLDCDFYVFSGHKLFGPTGIGALYAKASWLEAMPPYQGGGDMILTVTLEKTTYNQLPYKFEAGTPDIAGVIGLGAAIDYVTRLGLPHLAAYEAELLAHATARLGELDFVRLIGTAAHKASLVSFVLAGVHPHDVGQELDGLGIAVRAGHHCAMPLMRRFGVPATTRASFAFYNTKAEIDRLAEALPRIHRRFAPHA